MDSSTNQSSFWQFSDNLRLQTSSLSNLSLNDSIWSANYPAKRTAEERRNFDFRNGESGSSFVGSGSNMNSDFNIDIWKPPVNDVISPSVDYSGFGSGSVGVNGGFNKGIYSTPSLNFKGYSKNRGYSKNFVLNEKLNKGKNEEDLGKIGKKNKGNKDVAKDNAGGKSEVDKRFKTLPPAEALPRNETIGGYIFVCNNETMAENLKRQLFGLPPRYRDSVRAITPGLPLFLYNYSTHQLHGIFEAASFGGTNIDPTAWEDKKNPGESRFPAQVRVVTRKICEPMEEDSFRPILHHYDGPKFRLELNIPEALSLLDIFEETSP